MLTLTILVSTLGITFDASRLLLPADSIDKEDVVYNSQRSPVLGDLPQDVH